jgi:hypothetical protein
MPELLPELRDARAACRAGDRERDDYRQLVCEPAEIAVLETVTAMNAVPSPRAINAARISDLLFMLFPLSRFFRSSDVPRSPGET